MAMKRFLKILLITMLSLILLIVISISVVMWMIFTPEKLTPVLRSQVDKYIPYPSEVGEVELTFYSTFPDFGIRIQHLAVISRMDESPADTLLRVDELIGVMDAKAFWKNNELIIHKISLNNGSLNIFTDSLGRSNYDLFLTESETETDDASGSEISFINLGSIGLKNLNLSYTDLASQGASLHGAGARGDGCDGLLRPATVCRRAGAYPRGRRGRRARDEHNPRGLRGSGPRPAQCRVRAVGFLGGSR